jgi:hypothetical protein
MIELTRDLGGSIEQISTSKHIHNTMDNVFNRLMSETPKSTRTPALHRNRK